MLNDASWKLVKEISYIIAIVRECNYLMLKLTPELDSIDNKRRKKKEPSYSKDTLNP
jgi:hypothetical protein